ncbi:MAG: hypothetical protein ACTTIO_01135 [Candidatus Fimenecus sp.]
MAEKSPEKNALNKTEAEKISEKTATPKKEKKSKESINRAGTAITVLMVIAAIAAVCFMLWFKFVKLPADKNKNANTVGQAISNITLATTVTSVPYSKTDIPNVVYIAEGSGNINFFKWNGSAYEPLAASGSLDAKFKISGADFSVKINYIEQDGILNGFGVYLSQKDGNKLYDFMLLKLTNLPTAYQKPGKALLLLMTDKNSIYSDDFYWEDMFELDRATGQAQNFINQATRIVNQNGVQRPDFSLISERELSATSANIPYFSSRQYGFSTSADRTFDLFFKNGGKKDLRAVANILDFYAKPTADGGAIFIRKSENGFETVKYINGNQEVINTYSGVYGQDYVRSGDFILSKEDGKLYKTDDKTVIELPEFKINPIHFMVSPDEKHLVMLGPTANVMEYKVYVYNMETEKAEIYNEKSYAAHYNLRFLDNNTVSYYYINTDEHFTDVVLDISKIK